jgi:hypothetical protein
MGFNLSTLDIRLRVALILIILTGAGAAAYFTGRRGTQGKASAALRNTVGTLSNVTCEVKATGFGKSRRTYKMCSADVSYTVGDRSFTKKQLRWRLQQTGILLPDCPKEGSTMTVYYEPGTPEDVGVLDTATAAARTWYFFAFILALLGAAASFALWHIRHKPSRPPVLPAPFRLGVRGVRPTRRA